MSTTSLPKYDIETIERMIGQLDHLPDKEKWTKIGLVFGKSHSAVHRWYYRQKKNNKVSKEKTRKSADNKSIRSSKDSKSTSTSKDIPTDVIRTVYLLLLGKGCRIGYYQAITEIKAFLDTL